MFDGQLGKGKTYMILLVDVRTMQLCGTALCRGTKGCHGRVFSYEPIAHQSFVSYQYCCSQGSY